MPSLKDLRNRIASTKATQKITKAMQMVAASKLRRAQAAAEAARPYAERMDTVLGNIAASVAGLSSAPPLLRGTGSDQMHLLLVCTAERGLCGAVQLRDRAARARARQRADGRRQDGQVLLRRPQGLRSAAPAISRAQIVELVELRVVSTLRLRARRARSRRRSSRCSRRASSTSARCSSRASVR